MFYRWRGFKAEVTRTRPNGCFVADGDEDMGLISRPVLFLKFQASQIKRIPSLVGSNQENLERHLVQNFQF